MNITPYGAEAMKLIGLLGTRSHCTQVSKILEANHGYRRLGIEAVIVRMLASLYWHKFDPNLDTDGVSGNVLIQSLREWGYSHRSDYWIRQIERHIEFVKKLEYGNLKASISNIHTGEEIKWVKKNGGEIWMINSAVIPECANRNIDIGLMKNEKELADEVKRLLGDE